MKILVTICARGGSKGIPGKNFRKMNGKPLLAYSIKIGKEFCEKYGALLTLSTDSDEIKRIAADYGLTTEYVRPEELANDRAGKIDTLKDILLYEEKRNDVKFDYLLDLDVTSPLRTMKDLEEAFIKLQHNKEALNIFTVSPPNRNPYFNMVEPGEGEFYKLVKNIGPIKSRQTAPVVYDMNSSFYFYRRKFFDEGWQIAITDRTMVYLIEHMCFDLDHEVDFKVMEILLKENLLDFNFQG